jgi:hypothetical protein
MNFLIYMLGMVLLVAAVAYGAHLLGLSTQWIVIGVIALLGIGLMGGIVKTRQKDPAQ